MNKKTLIIKNRKTLIKEAEFNFRDILATTGIARAADHINQQFKIMTATVKLALKLVLSFRSLSLKKIVKNIKNANQEYDKRVRHATRNITQSIKSMGSESEISNVFSLTVPSVSFVNYLRTEIDDAGGLKYYLQDRNQSLIVGDLFADAYDVFDSYTDSLLEKGSPGPYSDRPNSPGRQTTRSSKNSINTKKLKKKFEREFKKKYGERAVNVYKDLSKNKNTDDVLKLKKLFEDISSKSPDVKERKLLEFFKSLNESKIKTIILSENKEDNKKYSNMFIEIVVLNSNLLQKSISVKSEMDTNVEDNLKFDIQQYENILSFLCFELFLITFITSISLKKQENISSVKDKILQSFLADFNSKELVEEFKSKTEKIIAEINKTEGIEKIQFCLSLLSEMKNKSLSENLELKSFIKKLNDVSNSKDKSFVNLKKNTNKAYEKVNNFNFENLTRIIENNIKEIEKKSSDK